MTKFSDFIRLPGTAGPPTREGIAALGFLLTTDLPPLVAGFLSVLGVQTFTSGQKLQGRQNLGLGTISTQDANAVAITGGTIAGIADLAVADGGTGASTAAAARTNLGLGTIATQAANAVAITGGTIAGITDLAVADGGTGASDAATARTNLGLGNVDNTSDANKPVSTAQQTALNLKANLASPPLTGTPTAPTAAAGTNTTQIATTAFVAALPFTKEYVSVQTAFATSAVISLTHGLGVVPKLVTAEVVCLTAEGGYGVGAVIQIATTWQATSIADAYGAAFLKTSTQVQVVFGVGGTFVIMNSSTFTGLALTPANWRLVVRAYA